MDIVYMFDYANEFSSYAPILHAYGVRTHAQYALKASLRAIISLLTSHL